MRAEVVEEEILDTNKTESDFRIRIITGQTEMDTQLEITIHRVTDTPIIPISNPNYNPTYNPYANQPPANYNEQYPPNYHHPQPESYNPEPNLDQTDYDQAPDPYQRYQNLN